MLILKSSRITDIIKVTPSFYAALFVAVAVGAGFLLMPPFSDGLVYMMPFRDYIRHGNGDWFGLVRATISAHYIYDNPRLANMVMAILAVVPRWLQALLSTAAIFVVLYEGIRLCRMQNDIFRCTLWMAGFLIFFPWVDQMYLFDLQLNYIWPCAMSLWLLNRIFERRASWMANFSIALTTAMFHGIYGGGLAAALLWIMARDKSFRTSQVSAALAGVVMGIIYVMLPRLHFAPFLDFDNRRAILYYYIIPVLIYVFMWLSTRYKQSKTFSLKAETLLVIAVTGASVMVLIPIGPRVGSFGIISAVLGAAAMARPPRNIAWRLTVVSVLWVFIVVHLFAVGREAYLAGIYTEDAICQYRRNPNSPVFVDMRIREEAPLICLQKPYYGWFAHECNTGVMTRYYNVDGKWMRVLPARLRNFNPKQAQTIRGGAGLLIYDGLIVGKVDDYDTRLMNLTADYGTGAVAESFYTVAFAHDGKGGYYAWYYPETSSLRQLLTPYPIHADFFNH